MTDEELKKKICKIIADNYLPKEMPDRLEDYKLYRFERAAEALIAAGIGDVKEAEAEANRYEMLYKMQSRDMVLAERKAHEAEHRAEVYYDALLSAAAYGDTPPEYYIEQAEKELVEEGKE